LATSPLARISAVVTLLLLVLATTAGDWPMFLHDAARSGVNPTETTLSASNVSSLTNLWAVKTGGVIAAQPAVVGGTVYIGSWDGYEYALDAKTGAVKWKTNLGITKFAACNPPAAGITSSAAVQNGVVYVGGGDAYWYALDARTGRVLWKLLTAPRSAAGALYNWSSPLIVGNIAYIGEASFGICPLLQSEMLKVDLTRHVVVASIKFEVGDHPGGGIWSSPAYDAASNTIYLDTGDGEDPLTPAIVALNATTLTVLSHWVVPLSEQFADGMDWGVSPALLLDRQGNRIVTAADKNGILYAFSNHQPPSVPVDFSKGPIWEKMIAAHDTFPPAGGAPISSGAFANGILYMAGPETTVRGRGYGGSVRAIDPSSGRFIWEHPDPDLVLGAIVYANGLIIDGEGATLEVLDARTGTRLFSYTTGGLLYAAPSIANGIIYIGSTDGNVYAFGLPAKPPAVPSPQTACMTHWICQDIGAPTPAGSQSFKGNAWTVKAAGTGMGAASDALRLLARPVGGDTQITARIAALPAGTGGAQAGLVVRQGTAPGAPYYTTFLNGVGTLVVEYRTSPGTSPTVALLGKATAPLYLRIQRTGDLFTAAMSSDGRAYKLIPGSVATVTFPVVVLAGIVASSGVNGTIGSAQFSHVDVGPPGTPPGLANPAVACGNGWTCGDIGSPAIVGSQTVKAGAWTVNASGLGIGYRTDQIHYDQFHYAWQTVGSAVEVTAKVTSQSNTNQGAAAGVMLRQSSAANAAFYAVFVTPGDGVEVLYRASGGYYTDAVAYADGQAPVYVRLTRVASSVRASLSSDGKVWTTIPGSEIVVGPSFGKSMLAGIAITSTNSGTLGTAQFSNVSIARLAAQQCPTAWSCADLGSPRVPGSESLSNGIWTVLGGGLDIWGSADQLHFTWKTLTGDGSVSAQVFSQSPSDPWAKSGVMIRAGTDAGAPFYLVAVTPQNGVIVEDRTTQGGPAAQAGVATGVAPIYLRVIRVGNLFGAYTSPDGTNWSLILGSRTQIDGLTGPVLAGMAVTSHDNNQAGVVTFHGVSVANVSAASLAAQECPAGWSCADIGSPHVPGAESLSSGVWTVLGGGADIWGTADQLHFTSQALSGDGSISAQVFSQSLSDPWAKAGVMLRAGVDPGAPFYFLAVTPQNGVILEERATQGGSAQQLELESGVAPIYLRVMRVGNSFSAFTSPDGTNWTLVVGSTTAIDGLAGPIQAGMAVTSHNDTQASQVSFHGVSVAGGAQGATTQTATPATPILTTPTATSSTPVATSSTPAATSSTPVALVTGTPTAIVTQAPGASPSTTPSNVVTGTPTPTAGV
jgi:outer membrane protein assembly factor BamB